MSTPSAQGSKPKNKTAATGEKKRMDALVKVARVQLNDEKQSSLARVFPAVFLAVLFVLLLTALVTGVRTYSTVAAAQQASNATREGLQLISNNVRANDAESAIAVGEGPEGPSLVVVEKLQTGTFEIRTYLYQGHVVQEYAVSGNAYTPASAAVLCDSETFSFGVDHGLLSITTDQGSTEVALRSLQGGE